MNIFADSSCDTRIMQQTALSRSLSISNNLSLLKLISSTQNKVAFEKVCKYLEGDIALAETILLIMTSSDAVSNKGKLFDVSKIGKELALILKSYKKNKNPSFYLSKNLQNQLGYEGKGLFDSFFKYKHYDYVDKCSIN